MDEPIQTALLLVADIDSLVDFYVSYPELRQMLSSKYILGLLSDKYEMPTQSSFPDFVISYNMRYGSSCFSVRKQFEIAIKEQDLKFLNQLLDKYGATLEWKDIKLIYETAGKIGNSEIIDLLLERTNKDYDIPRNVSVYSDDIRKEILLESLAEHHHNDLVEKYLDPNDYGLLLAIVNGAAAGNNFPLFLKYHTEIEFDNIESLIYYAAKVNSQEILDFIGEPEIAQDVLVYGYLAGGNLDKAKEIYEMMEDKRLDSLELISVLHTDCVDCFLFAEQADEVFQIDMENFLTVLHKIDRLSEVIWYLINRDPSTWKGALEKLLESDDFAGMIRIMQKFDPELTTANEWLSKPNINKCFVQWLKLNMK